MKIIDHPSISIWVGLLYYLLGVGTVAVGSGTIGGRIDLTLSSTPKMKKYYVPAFCQIMHLTVPMDR